MGFAKCIRRWEGHVYGEGTARRVAHLRSLPKIRSRGRFGAEDGFHLSGQREFLCLTLVRRNMGALAGRARKSQRCICIHGRRQADVSERKRRSQHLPYRVSAHRRRGAFFPEWPNWRPPHTHWVLSGHRPPIMTPVRLDVSRRKFPYLERRRREGILRMASRIHRRPIETHGSGQFPRPQTLRRPKEDPHFRYK